MATVEATLVELPEVVADMVRVQLLTGMRRAKYASCGPATSTAAEMSGSSRPPQHKTTYEVTIELSPSVLGARVSCCGILLDRRCILFSAKGFREETIGREGQTITPISCGNRRGTNCNGTSKAGKVYPVRSYSRAVERAAERAGVEHWTPQRLRHTKATDIRKDFGLDAAQAVLGHRGAKVTEVYAELDLAKAKEVAQKIG